MKETIKKIFKPFYNLYQNYKNNILVKNYFNTKFSKNVLVSYISFPFYSKKIFSHTNAAEAIEIAKVFKDLDYNCDVVNYNSTRKIDFSKYEIVFGFGEPLERSFSFSNKKIIRIYYGTVKHPYFNNEETIKKGLDFKKNKGIFLLDSLRLINLDYSLQTTAPDALVLLGDKGTVATYECYPHPAIYNLNVSFLKVLNYSDVIDKKDFSKAKNNFLFFSGGGMIHKGLDIVLDFFKDRKDLNLYVCAPVEQEEGFKNFYQKELFESENIYFYNFVDIRSEIFKELLEACAFVILPSCSEGMPTSIVTVAGNGGLIPILTKAASIGLDEQTIFIEDFSQEALRNSIAKGTSVDLNILKKNSLEIGEKINNLYTIQKYSKSIKEILTKIIK